MGTVASRLQIEGPPWPGRTHVSVSEVADVALEGDGLPGDGGDVPASVLEEGRVLLEDGLVVSEVLELT